MTREEAITRIKDHIEIHRYHERNAVKIFEALDMAIKALEQPEPCNLPQFDATCDGDILVKGVKMPKGCVYEGEDGKTEYCFLCNHADVPFCMYLEWEPEAAIGIDERPCYCPLEPQEPCEDAVSREAVTDVIRHSDIFSTWYEMDDTDDIVAEVIDEARKQLVDDVNELPSVTPKCPECDDAVSREAAIDAALSAFSRGLLASPDIRKLPSVQPERKTGRWLIREGISDAQCSECGMYFNDVYDMDNSDAFCRHCGAKMEGLKVVEDE